MLEQQLQDIYQDYGWVLYILGGALVTLEYSLLAVVFGIIIGVIIAVLRLSNNKFLRWIVRAYISVIRGTPLMLQLSVCFFVLPSILHINLSPFSAALFALSMNSSAYVAEIIRSGINAVDKGQFEAAASLNIPYLLMMRDIILPQSMRSMLPALVNEVVNLVKESAIIGVIGSIDLMRRGQMVAAERYTYFAPMMVVGACYYVMILILTAIAKCVERKINDRYI